MIFGSALIWQKGFLLFLAWSISILFTVVLGLILIRRAYLTLGALILRPTPDFPLPETLPKITVFIPVHNEESVIGATLEALVEADYPKNKFQVVVIDDGSGDSTKSMAESYKSRFGDMTIYSRAKSLGGQGKAAALNSALKKFPCQDICFFLDADSIIEPQTLKQLAGALSDPMVGAVSGRLEPVNPYDSICSFYSAAECWTHQLATLRPGSKMALTSAVLGSNWGIRRGTLNKYGFSRDHLLEDTNLSVRMQINGEKILFARRMKAAFQVPHNLKEYFFQHVGWGRGFSRIARAKSMEIIRGKGALVKKLDLLIYSWGYIDRPLLAGYLLMALVNSFSPLFFASCFLILGSMLMPLMQMLAAFRLAKRKPGDYFRIIPAAPMFFVDMAAALYAFYLNLLRRPVRWYKTGRRDDIKSGEFLNPPGGENG